MNDVTRTLIAVGASAAVNCRPCLAHHRAAAQALGIAAGDVAGAMEVGLQVGEGANRKTRELVASLVEGTPEPDGTTCEADGSGQAACALA